MSMNRAGIQRAAKLAQEFLEACEEALGAIDKQAAWCYANELRRQGREPEEWKRHEHARGSDHVWSSKETGTLRRRSMDLTRELAELRRP